jgi:UDP-2,4-diacetamido-2,4,6-trideoxy-beta-L-altropyranose hydrolase
MDRPHVVLVADADPGAGLGHVARCSALGSALSRMDVPVRARGWGADAAFQLDDQAWEPLSPDAALDEAASGAALVLDTYDEARAQRALAAGPSWTVAMVDRGTPLPQADLVVGLPPLQPPPGGHALTGLRHACLRRDFWVVEPRRVTGPVHSVLVTTGGSDPGGFGAGMASDLVGELDGVEVTLVRGPTAASSALAGVRVLEAPASLRGPLSEADLVVTAGGQSMLEALAVGTPSVVLVLAENQRAGAVLVAEQELAVVFDEPEPEAVVAAVTRLADDVGLRSQLAAVGQAAVDGRGALRVADAIAELIGG